MSNLFTDLPHDPTGEQFSELFARPGLRIERIVSTGQASPAGFWYEQPHGEWVLVLRGEATLTLEGDPEPLHMKPGDYVHIAAHRRHRVEWTHPREPTVWLTVHYSAP